MSKKKESPSHCDDIILNEITEITMCANKLKIGKCAGPDLIQENYKTL